ncbi:TonB-dependent siderophore receptor [Nitrospira sp. BLG_2]|uniref:TonB-dependent siderophore receptor n=1 Tax=Nitrospira sp. BLG_2 TaxID=3397507 RepID=UPI003BA0DE4D
MLLIALIIPVGDSLFAQENLAPGMKYRKTDTNAGTLIAEPATPGAADPLPIGENEVTPREQTAEPIESAEPKPVEPKPVRVPEIVVKETRERDTSYTVEDVSTATRIPVPVHDTPRSVEVVTKQVLEDQKVIRFSEALRNVSGVSEFSNQGGQGGTVMIRGFASDQSVFKNGFRDDSFFSSRAQRDIINIERIEVIKGPPSFLYGRADPGGVINQITKAPLKTPYYSAEMLFGNYDLYRPQIDIGGPLNESKTLTYRFNGLYENAGSYREGMRSERIFLAPTFGWEAGPRTTFRFEGEYLYDNRPIDRGLVAIGGGVAPIPISTFLGDPSRKLETNHGKATLTFLHDFNDVFKWRTAFRAAVASGRYSSLESNFLVGDENDGILNLARYEIPTTTQSHYLQNELHGRFSTGPFAHKTIVGVELGREVASESVSGDFGGDTSDPGVIPFSFINIFNPASRLFVDTPLSKFSNTKTVNNILGFYFGDHVSFGDKLHLHGGGRFDYFKQNLTVRPDDFTPTQSQDSQTNMAFSPSIGLTYQPWKPIAFFVNYTESFLPQAAGTRSITGTLFDPERGKSVEGGVKFQAFENRLRASVAAFNIKKKNVLTSDPLNGFLFSVATGEQRSQGIEFDIAGRILPGWDIIGNYAYIDARVTQDLLFLQGSRVPNSALNQGSLWTTYFLQEGPLKGLGAGVGMYAQGKRVGIFQCQDPANCQAPFELAGYVRMDAAVYYRRPEVFTGTNLIAAVNFTNLLDQRYFPGAQNFREIIYTGAPFTVIGSVKLEFN